MKGIGQTIKQQTSTPELTRQAAIELRQFGYSTRIVPGGVRIIVSKGEATFEYFPSTGRWKRRRNTLSGHVWRFTTRSIDRGTGVESLLVAMKEAQRA